MSQNILNQTVELLLTVSTKTLTGRGLGPRPSVTVAAQHIALVKLLLYLIVKYKICKMFASAHLGIMVA